MIECDVRDRDYVMDKGRIEPGNKSSRSRVVIHVKYKSVESEEIL